MKKAILILNNDTIFRGKGFGALGSYWGELVFNTAMTGYMEALTDPSYAGQILTFSYPLIGNYGASFKWAESKKIHPVGVVVSEICSEPNHREMEKTLEEILEKQKIGGISDVDTRMLIKIIREQGTIPAVLSVYENHSVDLVKQVTTQKTKIINPDGKPTIAVIDYGIKESIINMLAAKGAKIIIFPATSTAKKIIDYKPAGIVLSNGPGDPREFIYAQETVKDLLREKIPIFGICLGHQLLGLAAGGKIYKLKFGHRGINQPVYNLKTKKCYITSQNHSYAFDQKSLPKDWEISFINLNDNTVEGLQHKTKPIFSTQFHPEAHPGPQDNTYLYDKFLSSL